MTDTVKKRILSLKTRPAIVPALFFAAVFMQCGTASQGKSDADQYAVVEAQRMRYFELEIMPQLLKTIQHGDIVFRLGSDMTSELFRRMNEADKRYSHCGIASLENDTVFVYHALGGELDPNQAVQRHTLYQFAHPMGNKAVGLVRTRPHSNAPHRLGEWAQRQYEQKVPFDMQFDYASNDRLYCTEFVAKALTVALQNDVWLTLRQRGSKTYVTPDQLYINNITNQVIHLRY